MAKKHTFSIKNVKYVQLTIVMTHFITILSQDRYINLHTHKNIIVEQYQQYNIPLLGFRMSHTNLSVSYDCIYIGDKYRRKTKVTRVIHELNIENRST